MKPMTHEGLVMGMLPIATVVKLRDCGSFWVSESAVRYWKSTGYVQFPVYLRGKLKLKIKSVRKLN